MPSQRALVGLSANDWITDEWAQRPKLGASRRACIFTSIRNKAGDGVVYPFGGFDWLTAGRLRAGKAAPPTLAAGVIVKRH